MIPNFSPNYGLILVELPTPSPAVFAQNDFQPEKVRTGLRTVLEKARVKCHLELIMKNISTVRYKP